MLDSACNAGCQRRRRRRCAFLPLLVSSTEQMNHHGVGHTSAFAFTHLSTTIRVGAPHRSLTLPARSKTDSYEILSSDPLIYAVSDVLSQEECQRFIDRANTASSDELTRSNPPEVSLDVGRLWPLPFLCIGAGLPSVARLFDHYSQSVSGDGDDGVHITIQDVIQTALPPILIACAVAAALSFGVTQLIRSQSNATSRTSDALALNTDADFDLIKNLVSRVCKVSGNHPWTRYEAPVLTRYQPGAVFATHNDASPTLGSEWSDLGGQRVVTAITYLNDCPTGGGTHFDRLGITVQPKRGQTLVFYPADAQTLVADDRTRHESKAAINEKYIVQMFGRASRVPPPLGIPDSFSGSLEKEE